MNLSKNLILACHTNSMKKLLFILLFAINLAFAGEIQNLYASLAVRQTTDSNTTQTTPLKPLGTSGMAQLPTTIVTPISPEVEHGITEIGLERTRCYATCPAYTFIIYSDGSFRYVGEYGVDNMGEYTGTISLGQLNQVSKFINESDFFSFKDSYTSPYLDSAASYTMVKQNGKLKVIENYANSGPATLWAIEQLIDDLLDTALWDEGGNDR